MSRRKGIIIAYDSKGLPGFETGWGFSALITGRHNVLFDCGWDGSMLLRNLGRLNIGLTEIHRIVISHAHWDHLSGLAAVLREHSEPEGVQVFVPASFSPHLKREISRSADLREITGPEEIARDVFTTGELGNGPGEQSLLMVDGDECVVITGCAHPGIGEITDRASLTATPRWLIGGFHDAMPGEMPDGLDRVVMCHCTRHREEIGRVFGNAASDGCVGRAYAVAGRTLVENGVE